MKALSVLFTVCILSVNTFAQSKYNPLLLIPYNDHGKWGWCDTLGNIQVSPEFEQTLFFNEFKGHFLSEVKQNGHRATYVFKEGITGPKEYDSYMVYREEFFDLKCSIIQDSSGNMGLYNYRLKKILISPQFSYGHRILNAENQLFVFRNTQNVVCVYDFKTAKVISTKYTSFQKDELNNEIYFHDQAGDFYFLNRQMKFVKYKEELELDADYEDNAISGYEKSPKMYEAITDYNMRMRLSNTVKPVSGIKMGFNSELYVCFQNGNYGVLDRNEKIYLPFMYDFISIDYVKGYMFLIKDGKIGLKILNTDSDPIEPKYDYLKDSKQLKVSEKWNFCVFDAEYKGQRVFVGENGKEYYNFN